MQHEYIVVSQNEYKNGKFLLAGNNGHVGITVL